MSILTRSSKQFRLLGVEIFLGPQELVRAMPLKACRQAHHAEVVERAVFATRNSLKLQVEKKVLSPYSNIRAVTRKLCRHPRPTVVKSHLILELRTSLNYP